MTVLYEWGRTTGNILIGLYIFGTASVGAAMIAQLAGIQQLEVVLIGLLLLTCLPLLWFAESATLKIRAYKEETLSFVELLQKAPVTNWIWFFGVAVAAPAVFYYLGLREPVLYSAMAFFGLYSLTDTLLHILVSMNEEVIESVYTLLPENYTRSDIYETVQQMRDESEETETK